MSPVFLNFSRIKIPALLILFFAAGFGLSRLLSSPPASSFTEIRDSGGYRFINPLLECESANFDLPRLNQLRTAINNLIDQEIDSKDISLASVYYRDLNNGPWFGINEKELFSPASLIKVPLLMAVLKKSESDPSLLTRSITYNAKDFPPPDQNYLPDSQLVDGQPYTVDHLLSQMIVYSDNIAYDLLSTVIPPQDLLSVYSDLDVDISKSRTDPTGNIVSVKSYASFFRILFNSSYLTKAMSEKALGLLAQTTFRQGLVAGVPQSVVIAHKFGERRYLATEERQLHDCGIIYQPNKPYLLCIMTRGRDFVKMTTTIKQISQSFYQQLATQP